MLKLIVEDANLYMLLEIIEITYLKTAIQILLRKIGFCYVLMRISQQEQTIKLKLAPKSEEDNQQRFSISLKTSFQDDLLLKRFVSLKKSRPRQNIFVDYYELSIYESPLRLIFKDDALRSLLVENAGGSSHLSEALSIQYMQDRFGISKFTLEMEVTYKFYGCSMCDYLMKTKCENIAVSVTRAMQYIDPILYNLEDALRLMRKKLYGLIVARNGVTKLCNFQKSILHVWCQSSHIAEQVFNAYTIILLEIDKDDPIREVMIILSVCSSEWIYSNKQYF